MRVLDGLRRRCAGASRERGKRHVLVDHRTREQQVAFRSATAANMAQNALWRDNVAQTDVVEMDASDVTCDYAPKGYFGG